MRAKMLLRVKEKAALAHKVSGFPV
jgi:hypothetical protein